MSLICLCLLILGPNRLSADTCTHTIDTISGTLSAISHLHDERPALKACEMDSDHSEALGLCKTSAFRFPCVPCSYKLSKATSLTTVVLSNDIDSCSRHLMQSPLLLQPATSCLQARPMIHWLASQDDDSARIANSDHGVHKGASLQNTNLLVC